VFRYNSFDHLLDNYNDLHKKFGELFIQEFVTQKGGIQYQAEVFMDEYSQVKACVVIAKPRFFPVSGGTSTANVSIYNQEIEDISIKLLKSLNWVGAADIDFIFDPITKSYKVLEINPRVTAGIKIAFEAGVDFADLYVNFAQSRESHYQKNYKLDIYSRLLVLEFLWFIYSDRDTRKNTSPNFFNFFGKIDNHHFASRLIVN
jgi:predicted ATP-grasp superfamily ATP-dependent carboligase